MNPYTCAVLSLGAGLSSERVFKQVIVTFSLRMEKLGRQLVEDAAPPNGHDDPGGDGSARTQGAATERDHAENGTASRAEG
jgi:hypothetical protein